MIQWLSKIISRMFKRKTIWITYSDIEHDSSVGIFSIRAISTCSVQVVRYQKELVLHGNIEYEDMPHKDFFLRQKLFEETPWMNQWEVGIHLSHNSIFRHNTQMELVACYVDT